MSDHVGSGAEGAAGLGSVVGTRNPVQNQKDLWSLQLHREFVAAVNKLSAMTKYCLYLEKFKAPQHPNTAAGVAFSSPSNLRSPNFTRQDTARHLQVDGPRAHSNNIDTVPTLPHAQSSHSNNTDTVPTPTPTIPILSSLYHLLNPQNSQDLRFGSSSSPSLRIAPRPPPFPKTINNSHN